MNVLNVIIGILGLVAASIAAWYSVKFFRAGQEPRLALRYAIPYFTLRNIGTTTARNIVEKNGYFPNPISELFNFSGPVNVGQTGSSSVAVNMGMSKTLSSGEEAFALFDYENLSGQKFQSKFSVKRATNPQLSEQYIVSEVDWRRIK
jgi:hypothetical protein